MSGLDFGRDGMLVESATLWFTGLPASGKTTLAVSVERNLTGRGVPCVVLDGDELREGLSADLGLSREDRAEQARRTAHVAAMLTRSNVVAIVALVSPYAADRELARQIHEERLLPFIEVWVDTPLAECERRDPKGLYARARRGELTGMTGLDGPYEPPAAPELRVSGYHDTNRLMAALLQPVVASR